MTNSKKDQDQDLWSEISDSVLSNRHLTEEEKLYRQSGTLISAANVAKVYVGIAFISTSMSISQAGIYGSLIGFVYVMSVNLYCIWLLLKARNRFKYERIIDLPDLAVKLYGEGARIYMQVVLIITQLMYLLAYELFFGSQIDQLMCKTL